MKVDQVRDSVNCRVDEVRYFVKIVDVVRVDQVRVDQVRVDQVGCSQPNTMSAKRKRNDLTLTQKLEIIKLSSHKVSQG